MPLRLGTPMPELNGATEWVNGEAKQSDFAGSPTLVHFWAKSCHICHDNMPRVQGWRKEYADKGLKFVAIHMPRQQEDTDIDAVKADIAALGIEEPCAIDNQHEIGERFQTQHWPAYFLFDAAGGMKSRAAGDAGIGIVETAIKRALEVE